MPLDAHGQQVPVVLIGPMASGKTTLARELCRRHGYRFVDADWVIEDRHGPIPDYFRAHGEAGFRQIEANTVAELLRAEEHRNSVVSLGGGAPMNAALHPALAGCLVVYLSIDLDSVAPRIRHNTTRPMLQPDPLARWSQILAEREETYTRLADLVLDGRGPRPVSALAEELQQWLAAGPSRPTSPPAPPTVSEGDHRP